MVLPWGMARFLSCATCCASACVYIALKRITSALLKIKKQNPNQNTGISWQHVPFSNQLPLFQYSKFGVFSRMFSRGRKREQDLKMWLKWIFYGCWKTEEGTQARKWESTGWYTCNHTVMNCWRPGLGIHTYIHFCIKEFRFS